MPNIKTNLLYSKTIINLRNWFSFLAVSIRGCLHVSVCIMIPNFSALIFLKLFV